VVNTCDIVTRIPPPLGELYQHPGGTRTSIKPQFAIMGRVKELASFTNCRSERRASTRARAPPLYGE